MEKPTARCVKRLMAELKSLRQDPSPNFDAGPDPNDILKWCFIFDGATDTPFEGGRYVGRIHFDPNFPMKPPKIVFLTPNGRFSTNMAICLSNTSFHPEKWTPIWGIRTILTGLVAFMNADEPGLGALQDSEVHRRQLALASREFNVRHLQQIYSSALPESFLKDEKIVQAGETTTAPKELKTSTTTLTSCASESCRKEKNKEGYLQVIIGSMLLFALIAALYCW